MHDRPFGNTDSSITKSLGDVRNAPVRGISQGATERNHIETELSMGQCPTPLLFWSIRSMIAGTLLIVAPADMQRETGDPIQSGDGAVGVGSNPHSLAAPTALYTLWHECLFRCRRSATGSPWHTCLLPFLRCLRSGKAGREPASPVPDHQSSRKERAISFIAPVGPDRQVNGPRTDFSILEQRHGSRRI